MVVPLVCPLTELWNYFVLSSRNTWNVLWLENLSFESFSLGLYDWSYPYSLLPFGMTTLCFPSIFLCALPFLSWSLVLFSWTFSCPVCTISTPCFTFASFFFRHSPHYAHTFYNVDRKRASKSLFVRLVHLSHLWTIFSRASISSPLSFVNHIFSGNSISIRYFNQQPCKV